MSPIRVLAQKWRERSEALDEVSPDTPDFAREAAELIGDLRRILDEMSKHSPDTHEGASLMMDAAIGYVETGLADDAPEALATLKKVRNFLAAHSAD